MNCEDLNKYLEDFIDGSLPRDLQDDFEDSIYKCLEVKEKIYLYRKLFRRINNLPLGFDPPTNIVFQFTSDFRKTAVEESKRADAAADEKEYQKKRALEKNIKKLSAGKKTKKEKKLVTVNLFKNKLHLGLAVLTVVIISLYYFFLLERSGIWNVAIEKGSYEINNLASFDLELKPNDLISTDVNSDIFIYAGSVATINLKSNSTIKVLKAGRNINQMEFINGSIIYSSMQDDHDFLIFHKTTRVEDIRSTYEMKLLDDGSISIAVEKGRIKVQLPNDIMFLTRDYRCRILNSQTISLPVHVDASQRFINNLENLKANSRSYGALTAVLNEAKREDALTLLRILEIMPTRYRGMVFDKLNKLFPMPTWVEKTDVLRIDRNALDKWWENIEWQL